MVLAVLIFTAMLLLSDRTMATSQTNSKLSVAHKLEKALEFKEIGNSFYKESNFKNAAKNYHKAILYLKVSFYMTSYVEVEHYISRNLKVTNHWCD